MSIVADDCGFVVGVDTHAATHTYALVESPSGKKLGTETFPTTTDGLNRADTWLGRRTGGDVDGVLISAEGTGSYGAVMADLLSETGYRVVEAPAPSAKRLRGTGKTDTLDAIIAARSTLVSDVQRLRDRRAGELQTALLRIHDLRLDARKALTMTQIRSVAAWRRREELLSAFVARADAVRHAKRVIHLDTDLKNNREQVTKLVSDHAPVLLDMTGVGAVTAADIIAVWSHPGRVRSQAALAQIVGTCPIPASSGNTTRHRLLNRAINTFVLTRMRMDTATRVYVERRTAEGRTKREITRCLNATSPDRSTGRSQPPRRL